MSEVANIYRDKHTCAARMRWIVLRPYANIKHSNNLYNLSINSTPLIPKSLDKHFMFRSKIWSTLIYVLRLLRSSWRVPRYNTFKKAGHKHMCGASHHQIITCISPHIEGRRTHHKPVHYHYMFFDQWRSARRLAQKAVSGWVHVSNRRWRCPMWFLVRSGFIPIS